MVHFAASSALTCSQESMTAGVLVKAQMQTEGDVLNEGHLRRLDALEFIRPR